MDKTILNIDEDILPPSVHPLDIHIYRYGDEIVSEGEKPSCFFMIISGQVRISQKGIKIRILGNQDIFGLESIIFDRPCSYTAKALNRCRIATYGSDSLHKLVDESPRMLQSVLISTLHQLIQTAYNLSGESEVFAIEDIRVRFYGDGETIIEEGTAGTDFYRLVSTQGGLKVTIRGREIARIDKPGEFFGEMAGLLHLPRQASITSTGESVVEAYSADELDVIIRDYPDIALQIICTLVNRLIEANRKITGTYF